MKTTIYQYIFYILVFILSLYSIINYGFLNALNRGMWLDEGLSYFFISQNWRDFFQIITQYEANMAIYYLILKIITNFSHNEILLRLISFSFFLGCSFYVFKITKIYSNGKIALLTLFIFANHFFIIRYAFEIRSYMLASFLISGAVYHWFKAINEKQISHLIIHSLFLVLSVYAHILSLLIVIPLHIHALIKKDFKFYFQKICISHFFVLSSLLPLLIFFITKDQGQLAWVDFNFPRSLIDISFLYSGASPQANDLIRRILLGIFFFLIIFYFIKAATNKVKLFILLVPLFYFLLPTFIIILISFKKPLLVNRFLILFIPFFIITTGISLYYIKNTFFQHTLLSVIITLLISSTYYYNNRISENWKHISESISTYNPSNISLIFISPQIQAPFFYYYKRNISDESIYPYKLNIKNYLNKSKISSLNTTDDDKTYFFLTSHLFDQLPRVKNEYMNTLIDKYGNPSIFYDSEKIVVYSFK